MSIDWPFASEAIQLGGVAIGQAGPSIQRDDAERQTATATGILRGFVDRPGVLLSDEVGMGKTYVALAVAASVLLATRDRWQGPVMIMVPGRLRRKWQREWEQFKHHCSWAGSLSWVRDTYASSPSEFFKLLDDDDRRRSHLVFTTTGCFSRGLNDAWIKLGMIRLARQSTKLSADQKSRLYRWATNLIRQTSQYKLTPDLVGKLLNSDLEKWREILVKGKLFDDSDDDPVPALLEEVAERIDWSKLATIIRTSLPQRSSENIERRMKQVRGEFNDACQEIYAQWLALSKWRSPLLILDEAHHAKNDDTNLTRLFRPLTDGEVNLLQGKFERMLFLTATPFQLGHQELIRVIHSFDAIRWDSAYAPKLSRDEFREELKTLEDALDRNRLAGRQLDRRWGTIRPELLDGQDVVTWWRRVVAQPRDPWEVQLVEYVNECVRTKDQAQELLRPWVIRHNRPRQLAGQDGRELPRRVPVYGKAILSDQGDGASGDQGLSVDDAAALPFLLTARAQGELAQTSGARAFFAEGLSSSYEAFHDTRKERGKARDMTDEGGRVKHGASKDTVDEVATIVPTRWYEERIASLIPSSAALRSERMSHPKVSATVRRAVELWADGEKVLVFCFYRETCRALYHHLREEIQSCTLKLAASKLGPEYADTPEKVREFLTRVARRCSEEGRPFQREVRRILEQPFQQAKYRIFNEMERSRLIHVLAAYLRSPSFLARYLPLEDADVQRAWDMGEGRAEVLDAGIRALQHGILEHKDKSNRTCLGRIEQFLDYAVELAERSRTSQEAHGAEDEDDDQDEAPNPLEECLSAVTVHTSRPRSAEPDDDVEDSDDGDSTADDEGSYRVMPLVRIVHGETRQETRDSLALAFNSPLFPEVLVSSSVMGEGVDLHRFCRHVIHHDGCWNPSTLEQQTGRLDRIRCQAELCGMPIRVYQPFIAGSSDEKMFRVVRDRERWFQIVMGQKFEFDEGTSEELAARVPLPDELARELTFDLARWQRS